MRESETGDAYMAEGVKETEREREEDRERHRERETEKSGGKTASISTMCTYIREII